MYLKSLLYAGLQYRESLSLYLFNGIGILQNILALNLNAWLILISRRRILLFYLIQEV